MMRGFPLTEISERLNGELMGENVEILSVSTDSRSISGGDLFVALRGERFDGHDFVGPVAAAGAAAALVSTPVEAGIPTVRVADTELALGQLGAVNRDLFAGTLIGITGSCGKTSVKNMLAGILATAGPTLATEGNYNNEIGVPLTLLRLAPEHRFAVVEMGAGKPGDIAYLRELGRPQIGMLLNVMPAHLERMGSLEGIAETKGAILVDCEHAIYPADSEFTPHWRDLAGDAHKLEFAFDSAAPVHVSGLTLGADGSRFTLNIEGRSAEVALPLPGRHNVANAMAAAAAAVAAGLELDDIAVALAGAAASAGRLHRQPGRDGIQLIDDSYNANPGSVRAAIDVLAGLPGRRLLVLGTMAELGEAVDALHAEVGCYATAAGIDALWAAGPHTEHAVEAFGGGARHFDSREALIDALKGFLATGDVVLVKGSRSAGMEKVVASLLPPASNDGAVEEIH